MIDRATKLRWRRRVRRSRRHVEDFSLQAEEQIEQQLIDRLGRLWDVRRFLLSWLCLITMLAITLVAQFQDLSSYYQRLRPASGGTYTEGIIGGFTNANPLYAAGPVDSSVSRLLFSGLFTYDANNKLVGQLAEKWQLNDRGNVYTVSLKPNIKWQDGEAFNADDVVFTYTTIQNPDAKSVLATSWQGVKIAKVDDYTVTFTLPSPLSAFPYSMTNGIVPAHKLQGIPPGQLRSVAFNTTQPVGTGPFTWDRIEVSGDTPATREERLALVANPDYVGGQPKLERFVVRAFRDQKRMIDSFNRQELDGMAGLDTVPDELANHNKAQTFSMPLTSATMVFFRISQPALADVKVRQALVLASRPVDAVAALGYPLRLAHEPLLVGDLGFNPAFVQQTGNPASAKQLLDLAGWVADPKTGMRFKDGKPLGFTLYSESTSEYATVTQVLQKQWRAIGVDVQVSLQPSADLQTTFIVPHNYDALLYGISLGVDPDVFAYWHSSQADVRSPNRLNFSEYSSTPVDRALEAGRSRDDPNVRAAKYHAFLETWRNDAPALALYQPQFLYIARPSVGGLSDFTLNASPDRYRTVQNWTVRRHLTE